MATLDLWAKLNRMNTLTNYICRMEDQFKASDSVNVHSAYISMLESDPRFDYILRELEYIQVFLKDEFPRKRKKE